MTIVIKVVAGLLILFGSALVLLANTDWYEGVGTSEESDNV